MKRAVLPLVAIGILAVLAILLVIGLVEGDKTDQEQEEDRQDGTPALVHLSGPGTPAGTATA